MTTDKLFAAINGFNLWIVKRKARKGKPIRVVFIAMSVPMWHYQGIYDWLKKDKRFQVFLVLSPTVLWGRDEMIQNLKDMRLFFAKQDMPYLDWNLENDEPPYDIRRHLKPDIIFYTQPYADVHIKLHRYTRFLDKLLCHCHYGMTGETNDWNYNQPFHNIAWRLFFPWKRNLILAKQLSFRHGKNMRIVGYTNYYLFLHESSYNPWKVICHHAKRIIWAPHYSINIDDPLHYDSFLWTAEFMRNIAKKYASSIQFAFKPHPKLKSHLYRHPDWGKERTIEYYDWWASQINTQLETGEFIDLFKTSDAMIHDSGSFRTEYLYVHKPVMFLTKDVKKLLASSNDYLRKVYSVLYLGTNEDDIVYFIDDVVIRGDDPMREKREAFYQEELLPPCGTDVGKNIYDDICKSLGLTPQ